ncbi:MAG: adenylyltransferase/cytidyltransferase family protein [Candidatus Sungiibacteriota bacterium]|uniref:Adenylyltransferase/cytidyltransferase family protein n=1 Tax=Candidatus Sungiibacteriota bacterium TaxID=2750080 RepID=A0A7T5US99_9BACT|nr:MAG: adenylyltransferase/cytidyltransferase family protein [Candidatus Sungbacteria bacterium]
MASLISINKLAEVRRKHRHKTIVFCSGTFDLTHPGHVLFLEDCKKQGDILVVAVGDDVSIRDIKGEKRPIFNHHMRAKMINSLKPVDYCLVSSAPKGRPLGFMEEMFRRLKPDVYVVNEDAFDIPTRRHLIQKLGIKFAVLKRRCPKKFDQVSTTKLIEKIRAI